jgi:DNA recombination protein RmuC
MAWSIVLAALAGTNLVLLLVLLLRDQGGQMKSELARMDERLQGLNASLTKTEQSIFSLTRLNEDKLNNIRQSVEQNLKSLQEDNSRRLEQMRATVDEKLQSTLEKRLGESFTQVSERLESVYKGLGEMQKLASEVGNLKGVLSNIKTRGTLGEIQLEKILEQILSPGQYEKDANILGRNKVEFAIKLPGRNGEAVLLPIDSKLPLTEYERLCEAQNQADKELVKSCADRLEAAVKLQAKDIRDKYIQPPKTTDFAVMFLPIEGLFAEILRRPGLFDSLQNQYKVMVAGPTTFAALLNSLQMGFKTLAVEQRATEVMELLQAVKTDFAKFSDTLQGIKKNLETVSNKIDEATRRTRSIDKKLQQVQFLPETTNARLPPDIIKESEEPPEA